MQPRRCSVSCVSPPVGYADVSIVLLYYIVHLLAKLLIWLGNEVEVRLNGLHGLVAGCWPQGYQLYLVEDSYDATE